MSAFDPDDMSPAAEPAELQSHWPATRVEGLRRLDRFRPAMGRLYAGRRNHDLGPNRRDNVSMLSPYVRRRLVTEHEAVAAALSAHPTAAVEKFVQEVFWRSYWKGWLELRPEVWRDYQRRLAEDRAEALQNRALLKRLDRAEDGRTGVDCFDAWALELAETGYLHNHARMWFASIWVFTLGLPWRLGADLFLRRLLDADPASNTLGWRWVAGLQTAGKTYLARPDNIAKFTGGRFAAPTQLSPVATPPEGEAPNPKAGALRAPSPLKTGAPAALLLTEEDCQAETLPGFDGLDIVGVATLPAARLRAESDVSDAAVAFEIAALEDAAARAAPGRDAPSLAPGDLADWARSVGAAQIVTADPPTGWVRDALMAARPALSQAGVGYAELRRPWDSACWPKATAGFFKFKEKIPHLIQKLL